MTTLYQYAIILNERVVDGEVTEAAQLVAFNHVLADSEAKARILIAREIPEEYVGSLNRIEVIVRPF